MDIVPPDKEQKFPSLVKEPPLFFALVNKINRKGKCNQRHLVLQEQCIFLLGDTENEVTRRVHYWEITEALVDGIGRELGLRIPTQWDMLLRTKHHGKVLDIIVARKQSNNGEQLDITHNDDLFDKLQLHPKEKQEHAVGRQASQHQQGLRSPGSRAALAAMGSARSGGAVGSGRVGGLGSGWEFLEKSPSSGQGPVVRPAHRQASAVPQTGGDPSPAPTTPTETEHAASLCTTLSSKISKYMMSDNILSELVSSSGSSDETEYTHDAASRTPVGFRAISRKSISTQDGHSTSTCQLGYFYPQHMIVDNRDSSAVGSAAALGCQQQPSPTPTTNTLLAPATEPLAPFPRNMHTFKQRRRIHFHNSIVVGVVSIEVLAATGVHHTKDNVSLHVVICGEGAEARTQPVEANSAKWNKRFTFRAWHTEFDFKFIVYGTTVDHDAESAHPHSLPRIPPIHTHTHFIGSCEIVGDAHATHHGMAEQLTLELCDVTAQVVGQLSVALSFVEHPTLTNLNDVVPLMLTQPPKAQQEHQGEGAATHHDSSTAHCDNIQQQQQIRNPYFPPPSRSRSTSYNSSSSLQQGYSSTDTTDDQQCEATRTTTTSPFDKTTFELIAPKHIPMVPINTNCLILAPPHLPPPPYLECVDIAVHDYIETLLSCIGHRERAIQDVQETMCAMYAHCEECVSKMHLTSQACTHYVYRDRRKLRQREDQLLTLLELIKQRQEIQVEMRHTTESSDVFPKTKAK